MYLLANVFHRAIGREKENELCFLHTWECSEGNMIFFFLVDKGRHMIYR